MDEKKEVRPATIKRVGVSIDVDMEQLANSVAPDRTIEEIGENAKSQVVDSLWEAFMQNRVWLRRQSG